MYHLHLGPFSLRPYCINKYNNKHDFKGWGENQRLMSLRYMIQLFWHWPLLKNGFRIRAPVRAVATGTLCSDGLRPKFYPQGRRSSYATYYCYRIGRRYIKFCNVVDYWMLQWLLLWLFHFFTNSTLPRHSTETNITNNAMFNQKGWSYRTIDLTSRNTCMKSLIRKQMLVLWSIKAFNKDYVYCRLTTLLAC